ncbi:hypothetical protein [Streptomyces sp. V3I7]|uniref:hypothetical protein n=1 Tax=Streptomyces sp. V3I7 TaxID=3042278 RepID=UPI00278A073C|nr:hypothetical protein [Streptomyces sp. V3I7]MDQ0989637.1 hypothetical protein [Streptomyces sp. V3I7]
MKSASPAALVLGAVLGLAALTGCSAPDSRAEPSGATPNASGQPTDASAGKRSGTASGGCPTAPSLPLPKEFPARLPMPDGAVVTSVEHRSGDRLVVATVVRGGFDAALSFLQQRLPKAGFALKDGEVEEDDAESDFSSATVVGRWTLRKLPDCEGGVNLTYLTAPAG